MSAWKLITMAFLSASCASSVPGARFPLTPQLSQPAPLYVRYCYEGGTLNRDGRLLPIEVSDGASVRGDDLLTSLVSDGVDVESWDVKCYDASHRGWIALSSDVSFDLAVDDAAGSARVDVQLFRRQVAASGAATQAPGFFTIGAVGMKNVNNLGSLWRTAYQMGAAQIFTIGGRYEPQASDTVKCWRSTPLLRHNDWNAFAAAAPFGAQWVAVEFGGEPVFTHDPNASLLHECLFASTVAVTKAYPWMPSSSHCTPQLETFVHPERACYILGAEDTGLPESVLKACHRHVTLPSVQCNVAHKPVHVPDATLTMDHLSNPAENNRCELQRCRRR